MSGSVSKMCFFKGHSFCAFECSDALWARLGRQGLAGKAQGLAGVFLSAYKYPGAANATSRLSCGWIDLGFHLLEGKQPNEFQ